MRRLLRDEAALGGEPACKSVQVLHIAADRGIGAARHRRTQNAQSRQADGMPGGFAFKGTDSTWGTVHANFV